MKKVMVAHPAQQHSFRLAEALHAAGMLDSYCTTVYNKPGSLTALSTHLLRGSSRERAMKRHMDIVPDSRVKQWCELSGLAKLFCMHVSAAKKFYPSVKHYCADAFAKKAARLAMERGVDAVITFDDTSPLLFEILKRDAPEIKRITDMSAASLRYMRCIYERDFELKPAFREHLLKERANVFDDAMLERERREMDATQFFLCGSEFVKRSICAFDVALQDAYVCYYGVDVAEFAPLESKAYEHRPLRFCFLGGTKELKGLAYILDIFKSIDPAEASLSVIGANTLSEDLCSQYSDRVDFMGSMMHDEVAKVLREMDVMLFPSLGDGFGLALLEGLASGLPAIATVNAGASEIMTDGADGFIVPIQDQVALEEKIRWFMNNRGSIPTMACAARKTAEGCTWDQYSRRIVDTVGEICSR